MKNYNSHDLEEISKKLNQYTEQQKQSQISDVVEPTPYYYNDSQKTATTRRTRKSTAHIWIMGLLLTLIVLLCALLYTLYNTQTFNFGGSGNGTVDDKGNLTTNDTTTTAQMNSAKVYEEAEGSVVTIINHQRKNIFEESGDSAGTGFIYKKADGYYYVLTNNHVVDRNDSIEVLLSGDKEYLPAQLIGVDSAYDIAILRFKSNKDIKALSFGNSDNLKPGEEVVAIGSPYGPELQGTITRGVVSAPLRTMDITGLGDRQYIQIDAAINSGNSGGPLLNANAQVVGINTLKIAAEGTDNIGFSIPSNEVVKIVNQIEKNTVRR